jgi:microcystin-dependent protein
LRNRFIIGAHSDDAGVAKTTITGSPTQTGGSKDATVVSHTHTASSAAHQHSSIGYNSTGNIPYGTIAGQPSMGMWSPQGNNTTHVLSSSTAASVTVNSAGSSGTDANLVPYFALAYIMKL